METGDTVKLMKTILVTGCSHSSGCERIDKLLFQGYNKFLQDAKHQTEYEVHNIVQKHKIKYLLENFKCLQLKKLIGTDYKKAGEIIDRFFVRLEKSYSWPAELQKKLKNYKVINLAKGGNSFKINVKQTLDFMKNVDTELVCIHQVPSHPRTYVKCNGTIHNVTGIADLNFKKELRHYDADLCAILDILKNKYKNLVLRDVYHDYFHRANAQYYKCLLRNSNNSTKHFFIIENDDQIETFGKENIILANFKNFRLNYKLGRGHVIDDQFGPDIANIVINKIIKE